MELTAADMKLSPEELQAKIDDATKDLKANRDDILGQLRTVKDKVKAFDGIDLELLQQQSKDLAKMKESQLTDAEKLERDNKERQAKLTATQQALLDANAKLLKVTTDNAVANALRDAGQVQEGMGEAVSLLISQRITMSDDNVPMVGAKTVPEYVSNFAENEGKGFFVPRNSGGGGNGSGGSATSITEYTNQDGSLNNTKLAQLRKGTPEDVAKAETIVAQHKAAK